MRDYDPTLGRYIQADPLGLVDGASVYGYALQSPLRYVDPRGESLNSGRRMPKNDPRKEAQECKVAAGRDGCQEQYEEESGRCWSKYIPGSRNLNACLDRAADRLRLCNRGQAGPPEWGPAEEYEGGKKRDPKPWWENLPPPILGPVRIPGGGGGGVIIPGQQPIIIF